MTFIVHVFLRRIERAIPCCALLVACCIVRGVVCFALPVRVGCVVVSGNLFAEGVRCTLVYSRGVIVMLLLLLCANVSRPLWPIFRLIQPVVLRGSIILRNSRRVQSQLGDIIPSHGQDTVETPDEEPRIYREETPDYSSRA